MDNLLFPNLDGNSIITSKDFCLEHDKCVIIIIIDTIMNHLATNMIEVFNEVNEIHYPYIIFITTSNDINNKEAFLNNSNCKIDYRNIIVYQYNNDTLNQNIMISLLRICSYYNELGDSFSFPKTKEIQLIQEDAQIRNGLIDTEYNLYNRNYQGTMNMIISGQPGVGKSTFINKILGEKRCKEGRGRPVTSKILKYMQPLFPIAIYDTPGLESEKDVDKVIDLIKKQQNALLEGKDQIHLILFLINQETSRTLLPNDLLFIKMINRLNIKVLYVITRSMTYQRGIRFKEVLALTLKNEFRRPIEEYRNKIYPVHLVNEQEDLDMNHIESFGLHDLFS